MHKLLGLVFVSSVAATACGGSLGGHVRNTISRYEVGNYNAAANHCGEVSDFEADLNDKARVRYLVYCGLTHYRLGKREEARGQLAQGADEYLQGKSNWLKPAIVDELYKALDDLEGRARDRGGPSHGRMSKPEPPPSAEEPDAEEL